MVSVFAAPSTVAMFSVSRVLVAGGTGIIGSGIVQALLFKGAKVVVGTRFQDNYNKLYESTHENLRCNLSAAVGDVRTEDGVKAVFDKVLEDECHGCQHVVAALRGNTCWWESGRTWDQPLCDFYDGAVEEVTGNFLLMKAFLPYLESIGGSTYTIVTGYPVSPCLPPCMPSSLVCLASGTVCGLADGARSEHKGAKVAVSEVHLKCTVHKRMDCYVSCMGPQHLGNDLIGSVVAAVASCGARREVVINCRQEAWAIVNATVGVSQPCPLPRPPCPPACPPTPYPPCPPVCPPTPCPPRGPCP